MASSPLYFFEQTDFSLRLARCTDAERPLRIDELKEVTAEESAALIESLPANATIACALRPRTRALHLSTVDEAKRHPGLTGIRKFVELSSNAERVIKWYAAVQAHDGAVPGATPWLLSTSADFQQTGGTLESLKTKPVRCASAMLSTAGALARSAHQAVLLLEVGELASHAMLIGRDGVIAAGAISLDIGRIGEAVQTELNLKFRGSAVKLFFNPDYDFTEVGPKIADRLATQIKPDLSRILANRTPPAAVFVAGLPAAQQWFAPLFAAALKLPLHAPDIKAWSTNTGITFASAELATRASAAWFGTLDFLNGSTRTKSPAVSSWVAEWHSLNTAAPAVAPAPAAPGPASLPPKPAAEKAPASAPTATKAPSSVKYSTSSSTSVAGLDDAPPPKAHHPQKPALSPAAAPASAAKPVVTPKKPAPPAVAKPPVPPAPPKSTVAATPAPAPVEKTKSAAGKKFGAMAAIAGVIILLVVSGFLYMQAQGKAAAEQFAHEKQQTAQQLKIQEEKARAAEQKAREESDSRKKIEAELSQKLVNSEAARQQAESEAQALAAAHLANARGSLSIKTNPPGATVAVGNLSPQTSPAVFTDIKIGTYPVTISLPGYGDMKLDFVVNENTTTDSGLIVLPRLAGSLKITSEPGPGAYELHPANAMMISPESRRSGATPATVRELTPGDYSVTLTRDGCSPHTQIVAISRDSTTYLRWEWPNGAIKIISSPPGATVMRGSVQIGVTPLTLSDQPAGEVGYDIVLDKFDPVAISGRVEPGKTLDLAAQFKPEDRIFTADEVDRKPEPLAAKSPELPYYLTLENGRLEIELTVNRDGSCKGLRLVQASNPDLGKFYLEAVAKWQFKPGLKGGVPVNVKFKLPVVVKAKS